MTKWILFSIAALLTGAVACEQTVTPPERAKGVPMAAQWAGGPDGGAWILCEVVGNRNRCTIYNDYTGAVWSAGDFVVRGTESGVGTKELQYSFFDGDAIHLEDGRVLVTAR